MTAGPHRSLARGRGPLAAGMLGVLASAGAWLPAAVAAGSGDVPIVRDIVFDLPPNPDARAEHFVLEALDDGDPHGGVVERGVCVWRRRDFAGGTHLERELSFERGSKDLGTVTVHHVEELSYDFARLVWREHGTGIGRTLFAEWTREHDSIRAAEWGLRQSLRETQSAARGAVMPLYLLELARAGRVATGPFLVCDPLSQTLERMQLSTVYSVELGRAPAASAFEAALRDLAEGQHLRIVELVRGDGTLAARAAFRRHELVGFQWQEGDAWARRITAEEYRAHIEDARATSAPKPQ